MGVVKDIRNGRFDEKLGVIARAVRERQRVMGLERFASMQIGQKVRFVSEARPTYLAGLPATVVGKKSTKLMVRLERPVGKYRGGDIKVPGNLVEVDDRP